MQVKADKEFGGCGCGRSPTGKCIGWHGLSEDEYRVKLAEYEDSLFKEPNDKEVK
jgi:hypothetical protein